MNLHVFPQGAGVCVGLVAQFAQVRFVGRVDVHVLLAVTAVGKTAITSVELTHERLFSCMRSLVYLEVLGAREHLATPGEGAGEGLLAGVHAHVVDQLVFGLEGLAVARAVLPPAHVLLAVLGRPPDVLGGHMRHQLVHGAEGPAARPLALAVALPRPPARELELALGAPLAHVAEERVRVVRAHVHVRVHVQPVLAVRVGGGGGCGARENVQPPVERVEMLLLLLLLVMMVMLLLVEAREKSVAHAALAVRLRVPVAEHRVLLLLVVKLLVVMVAGACAHAGFAETAVRAAAPQEEVRRARWPKMCAGAQQPVALRELQLAVVR